MCAIAGIFSPFNINLDFKDRIKRMLNSKIMHARGPDDIGIWSTRNCTLGHNRLSITGINNGHQPISYEYIHIVVNGEIYNWKELRNEFKYHYEFKTDSDSEVIIPLYKKYGIYKTAQKLNGEFAFLLFDEKENKLYAVRDRYGIKPLYYYFDKDYYKTISFASDPLVLKQNNYTTLSTNALIRACTMHYLGPNQTLFTNINQIEPGQIICYSYNECYNTKYYDINYINNEQQNNWSEDELKEKLIESVIKRLNADVPICCHLSGGLDSSTVLGIASKYKDVDVFSIIFDDNTGNFNELNTIDNTIAFNNISKNKFHKIHMSQNLMFDLLRTSVISARGLTVNAHISCKYALNQAIKDAGFKVALTGEGADECFFGYSHLKYDYQKYFSEDLMMVGTESPDGNIINFFDLFNKIQYIPRFLQAKLSMGAKFHNLMTSDTLYYASNTHFDKDIVKEILNNDIFKKQYKFLSRVEISNYIWMKTALPNYILQTLGDGCEMPNSVEGRLPFLDVDLFNYVANIKCKYKYKEYITYEKNSIKPKYHLIEKYLLRKIAKDFITSEIYNKTKQPFQAPPLTYYLDNKHYNQLCSDIFDTHKKLHMFDQKKLENILKMLKNADLKTHIIYEPIIMILLSIGYLNEYVISLNHEYIN